MKAMDRALLALAVQLHITAVCDGGGLHKLERNRWVFRRTDELQWMRHKGRRCIYMDVHRLEVVHEWKKNGMAVYRG